MPLRFCCAIRASCFLVCVIGAASACSSTSNSTSALDGAADSAPATATETAAPKDAGATPAATASKKEAPTDDLTTFIKNRLPKGGSVDGEPPKITHKVQAEDSLTSISEAYLEVTEFYKAEELAQAIAKSGALEPGKVITIPRPLSRVLHAPKDDKLGWPEDRVLKGVFVTGTYANIKWADTVDKVEDHGLNAIVLDAKDYEGYVNYPSKAKIALESGAIRDKNIPDLTRAIRYAHWHNVRIILRIPCFHDPWADKHLPDSRLSIKFTPTGKPIHVDWIDPTNSEAQDYAIELAKEGIEAGADEIQLDYVRFPVHLAMKVAVLPQPHERKKVIRDFVRRVATVTHEAGVHLSLDFFGVAATGEREDIEKLGQDIATVAPEADAISLMTYPSHYANGYLGFTNPADHPEIIGIGNKMALAQLKPTGAKTVFRTWLQAFPLKVTHYGSDYLLAQAKSAETSGGHGWLMWSPNCEYSPVWNGWPSKKKLAQASSQ